MSIVTHTPKSLSALYVAGLGSPETKGIYQHVLKSFCQHLGSRAGAAITGLTLTDYQNFARFGQAGKTAKTWKRDLQAVRGLIRHAIAHGQLTASFWIPMTTLAKATSSLNTTPTPQPTPAVVVPASIASAPVSTPAPATQVSGPASCTMTPPSNPVPTAALPDPGELLTFKMARAVVGVSRGTLWRWTKAGLPIRGKMGVKRIGRDDLKRYLGIPIPATPAVP